MITERLLKLDPSLELHNEGEWSNSTSYYSAFNDGGVECETGEFLYSLVRLLKPNRVLETGTHYGVGASYMGMGLKDNGFGKLDTLEFLPEIHAVARKRIETMGLTDYVNMHLTDAAKFDASGKKYKLVLLDTEPQTRFAEFLRYLPFVDEGGFIFIHDLHRHMHQIPNEEHGFAWPYGVIPHGITQLVKDGAIRPFHFSTPRGLTGFYVVAKDDYKWE